MEAGESYQKELQSREELPENLAIKELNPDRLQINNFPTPSIGINNETDEPNLGEVKVEFTS